MPASYPTATKSFTTKTDGPAQTIYASYVNDIQDEVVAVENGLRAGLQHDLLFTDATYDIGKVGATRPRDIFASRNIVISGVGPHAFGAAATVGIQFGIGGVYAPASGTTCRGVQVSSDLTAQANVAAGAVVIEPILNGATSGSHAVFASLWVKAPTINVTGLGVVAASATVYIEAAPTGATVNYALRVAGLASFNGQVNTEGGIFSSSWERNTAYVTPAQITGNQNNYNPTGLSTARILRLDSDASRNITGIVAQAAGFKLLLQNVGGQDIVLIDSSGSSTAANQFEGVGNTDKTLNSGDGIEIWYDGTSSRWRMVGQ